MGDIRHVNKRLRLSDVVNEQQLDSKLHLFPLQGKKAKEVLNQLKSLFKVSVASRRFPTTKI